MTNDGVHSYTYDGENRPVSVDGGATAQYSYDQNNRRYKKAVGSFVTHCVWEGSQVVAEYDGSTGALIVDYVYSNGRMIAKVLSGTIQYFLSDRLSERVVLDTSGNVSGRESHLPYGEDFGESGTQEKHHFTSYERDNETQKDYAVNRQYEQGIGRFMRVDPHAPSMKNPLVLGSYGDPQSLNRYNYSRNDPINAMDPLGLMTCFGYDVFILTYWGDQLIAVTYLGFLPVYCWGDGGGGGNGPPPDSGGGTGQPAQPAFANDRNQLRDNYRNIRDWVLSRGSCASKLRPYMGRVDSLASDYGILRLFDTTDVNVVDEILPGTDPPETVGHYFSRTGSGAYTYSHYEVNPRGRRRLTQVEIYLGPDFFDPDRSDGDYQATLYFHELLHGALMLNDSQLVTELHITPEGSETDSDAIQRWLNKGCP